ncbi:hypothetical protein [Chitinophaga sp.]|uniref:hypothetical protein n=1 Tax=Chitinophaga sp. TaxID=1869181 RepID=UPI0031D54AA0
MKINIFLIVVGVAFSLCFTSCKKNADSIVTTPPKDSSRKVMVSLQPAGEFILSQTPLTSGKVATGNANAKEQVDSTLYMVEVYDPTGKIYAYGAFNRLDSVHFVVDPVTHYTVRLTVIQRGTGPGIAYSQRGEDADYYWYPVSSFLRNGMEYSPYLGAGIGLNYTLFKSGFTMAPANAQSEFNMAQPFGECTTYSGTASVYNVNPDTPTIPIFLKKLTFGIKYTCPQLTQGKLTIATSHLYLPAGPIYPNTISTTHIYSCLDFLLADTLPHGYTDAFGAFAVKIVWELPDGRKFNLGKDSSNGFYTNLPLPRRNRLLNVNVTLPDIDSSSNANSSSLKLKITETPFTENTPIRF